MYWQDGVVIDPEILREFSAHMRLHQHLHWTDNNDVLDAEVRFDAYHNRSPSTAAGKWYGGRPPQPWNPLPQTSSPSPTGAPAQRPPWRSEYDRMQPQVSWHSTDSDHVLATTWPKHDGGGGGGGSGSGGSGSGGTSYIRETWDYKVEMVTVSTPICAPATSSIASELHDRSAAIQPPQDRSAELGSTGSDTSSALGFHKTAATNSTVRRSNDSTDRVASPSRLSGRIGSATKSPTKHDSSRPIAKIGSLKQQCSPLSAPAAQAAGVVKKAPQSPSVAAVAAATSARQESDTRAAASSPPPSQRSPSGEHYPTVATGASAASTHSLNSEAPLASDGSKAIAPASDRPTSSAADIMKTASQAAARTLSVEAAKLSVEKKLSVDSVPPSLAEKVTAGKIASADTVSPPSTAKASPKNTFRIDTASPPSVAKASTEIHASTDVVTPPLAEKVSAGKALSVDAVPPPSAKKVSPGKNASAADTVSPSSVAKLSAEKNVNADAVQSPSTANVSAVKISSVNALQSPSAEADMTAARVLLESKADIKVRQESRSTTVNLTGQSQCGSPISQGTTQMPLVTAAASSDSASLQSLTAAGSTSDSTSPPAKPAASSTTSSAEQRAKTPRKARDSSTSVSSRQANALKSPATFKPRVNPQVLRYAGAISKALTPDQNKDISSSHTVNEPRPTAPSSKLSSTPSQPAASKALKAEHTGEVQATKPDSPSLPPSILAADDKPVVSNTLPLTSKKDSVTASPRVSDTTAPPSALSHQVPYNELSATATTKQNINVRGVEPPTATVNQIAVDHSPNTDPTATSPHATILTAVGEGQSCDTPLPTASRDSSQKADVSKSASVSARPSAVACSGHGAPTPEASSSASLKGVDAEHNKSKTQASTMAESHATTENPPLKAEHSTTVAKSAPGQQRPSEEAEKAVAAQDSSLKPDFYSPARTDEMDIVDDQFPQVIRKFEDLSADAYAGWPADKASLRASTRDPNRPARVLKSPQSSKTKTATSSHDAAASHGAQQEQQQPVLQEKQQLPDQHLQQEQQVQQQQQEHRSDSLDARQVSPPKSSLSKTVPLSSEPASKTSLPSAAQLPPQPSPQLLAQESSQKATPSRTSEIDIESDRSSTRSFGRPASAPKSRDSSKASNVASSHDTISPSGVEQQQLVLQEHRQVTHERQQLVTQEKRQLVVQQQEKLQLHQQKQKKQRQEQKPQLPQQQQEHKPQQQQRPQSPQQQPSQSHLDPEHKPQQQTPMQPQQQTRVKEQSKSPEVPSVGATHAHVSHDEEIPSVQPGHEHSTIAPSSSTPLGEPTVSPATTSPPLATQRASALEHSPGATPTNSTAVDIESDRGSTRSFGRPASAPKSRNSSQTSSVASSHDTIPPSGAQQMQERRQLVTHEKHQLVVQQQEKLQLHQQKQKKKKVPQQQHQQLEHEPQQQQQPQPNQETEHKPQQQQQPPRQQHQEPEHRPQHQDMEHEHQQQQSLQQQQQQPRFKQQHKSPEVRSVGEAHSHVSHDEQIPASLSGRKHYTIVPLSSMPQGEATVSPATTSSPLSTRRVSPLEHSPGATPTNSTAADVEALQSTAIQIEPLSLLHQTSAPDESEIMRDAHMRHALRTVASIKNDRQASKTKGPLDPPNSYDWVCIKAHEAAKHAVSALQLHAFGRRMPMSDETTPGHGLLDNTLPLRLLANFSDAPLPSEMSRLVELSNELVAIALPDKLVYPDSDGTPSRAIKVEQADKASALARSIIDTCEDLVANMPAGSYQTAQLIETTQKQASDTAKESKTCNKADPKTLLQWLEQAEHTLHASQYDDTEAELRTEREIFWTLYKIRVAAELALKTYLAVSRNRPLSNDESETLRALLPDEEVEESHPEFLLHAHAASIDSVCEQLSMFRAVRPEPELAEPHQRYQNASIARTAFSSAKRMLDMARELVVSFIKWPTRSS